LAYYDVEIASETQGKQGIMSTSAPFIIAGGGIGGLALARSLALKGRRSIVLEQAPEFGEIGAGIQLGPNVDRMFERMQVRPAMRDIAFYPENLIMNDSVTGEEVTRLPAGQHFIDHFGGPYGVIHRADLHSVLLDACRETPELIELHASTRVTAFQDHGDRVTATSENGKTFEGEALVGCDGLWSEVRQYIVKDGNPRVSGHIAYRAVLKIDEVPEIIGPWMDDVVLWAGPKNHLVHYKLRRGELFNIVAVFHSDRYVEGWDSHGDPEELHKRFAGTRPEVQALLDKVNVWRMWVLCDREPVREWTKGRVTLLGDAAHPMLQYLAAGAGMAMEDAVCLADTLDANNGNIAKTFIEYPEMRYLRTGRVQTTARYYGDVYHAAGVVRELRNQALAGRDAAAAYKGMEWLYMYGR
jgi:2-polyprenyl-6-methoxyphenol hydroxylase-like FAD-dependent oxidoreductase